MSDPDRCPCGFFRPGPMHRYDCTHYDTWREQRAAIAVADREAERIAGFEASLGEARKFIAETNRRLDETVASLAAIAAERDLMAVALCQIASLLPPMPCTPVQKCPQCIATQALDECRSARRVKS